MYTVNPFREKGRAAADLTSTHPPISERIRILRSMAGASVRDYEQAYEKVRGGAKVVPASAMAAAESVSLRAPSEKAGDTVDDRVGRARETSDLMQRLGNYRTIDCPCGTKLKVPATFKEPAVKCPHCGRIHRL